MKHRGMKGLLMLAIVLALGAAGCFTVLAANKEDITVGVEYCQTEARRMLEMINEFRTGDDAWAWDSTDTEKVQYDDLSELKYDYQLEAAAMQRAAEIALSFSHTRPDGTSYSTVDSLVRGENLAAGIISAEEAFSLLQETEENYGGQGHRRNMLNSSYKTVGIGCVYYQGYYYWAQEFSYSEGNTTGVVTAVDGNKEVTVAILTDSFTTAISAFPRSLSIDRSSSGTASLPDIIGTVVGADTFPGNPVPYIIAPDAVWTVADSSVASINDDGTVTGLKDGTTTLTATALGKAATVTLEVDCGHTSVSLEGDKAATCTDGGYTGDEICGTCGETATEGTAIQALGHDYKVSDSEAPTCTTDGFTAYTCGRCDSTYQTTETAGHDYEEAVTEPTCTEKGYTTYTCEACGDSYVSDDVDATGHDYEEAVTEPTCTEKGYTTYTCADCGDSYKGDDAEATGHMWEEKETVDPTCDENGYTIYACSVCGETKTDNIVSATVYTPGDVNGDSKINIADLRLILRSVCGKAVLTEEQEKAADVTGDGNVDIQDLRKVLRYVCGKITKL